MCLNKRLFIGFPLEISSSLTSALKRTRITAQKKGMEFNWTPEANIHVTLNFIGNTPGERLPDLQDIIAAVAAETPPIQTSLRGMGAFPDERHMRVLYVGVRKSRAMSELQSRLKTVLLEAGFHQEERDFAPHLTVGRLRKSRSGTDLISPYVRTSFCDATIGSIILYESLISGSHPVYKVLSKFELSCAEEPDGNAEGSGKTEPREDEPFLANIPQEN
jgi:RNA 2',3'-cyclic 3'-phosphodiesterase